MKALLLEAPGTPATLKVGETPDPAAGTGELLVSVRACGLNPIDYKIANRGHPAWSYPHVLGLDVAGVVEAVGAGVEGFTVGERVAYHGDLRRSGGYAELSVTTARSVAHIPDDVAFAQAAALPCAGLTAYQAIFRRLHVEQGQTVLITAGAGGVGGFAVQLAHAQGARVIATASAPKHNIVKGLGADAVIDYAAEDIAARVMELTGGVGVDGVVDTVGSGSASEYLKLVTYGGGVVGIAGRPEPNPVPGFTTAPSLHEVALGAAYPHGGPGALEDLATMLNDLMERVAQGTLEPMIDDTFGLDGVAGALEALATGHSRGKKVYVA